MAKGYKKEQPNIPQTGTSLRPDRRTGVAVTFLRIAECLKRHITNPHLQRRNGR